MAASSSAIPPGPLPLRNRSSPTQPRAGWSRIDGVDALRALAILYVLLNHVHMRLLLDRIHYTQRMPRQLVWALVWQGQRGVQIFFAVSGFLITSTALRRWGTLADIRLRDFYLIRFARIAPLLLTLLAVLSLLHGLHLDHFVVLRKLGGLPAALLAALTFHVGYFEATRGYLPANWDILWSLGVEEVFYLGFPLACVLLGRFRLLRGRPLVAFLLLFVLLGPFARTVLTHGNEVWQEYSYFGGMDAIALGCLTAIFLAGRQLRPATLRILTGAGLALLTFGCVFTPQMQHLHLEDLGLGMTLVALASCMLIAAAAQSRWQAPAFAAPFLACGRRSYEIYLTHMFVVFLLFDRFLAAGKPIRLTAPLFLGTIVLAGLLGELVGRFYSEPLNRALRDRFGDGSRALGSVRPAP